MVEMAQKAAFYYLDEPEYDEKAVAKFFISEQIPVFTGVRNALADATFDAEGIERAFKQVLEQTGLKFGKVGQPTRVALSGGTSAPGIYEVALVLGRERCIQRLNKAIAMCA
jgi:glutamyl-tRNA synthetase